MNKEKIIRAAERCLKRSEPYQEQRDLTPDENYQIDFILVKRTASLPENVIAYASFEDSMISFHPLESTGKDNILYLYDWSFSFDEDVFGSLEQNYELITMSPDCHWCVWTTIAEDWKNGDTTHAAGMQKYLEYCKRNGITYEKLHEKADYDGMDVMTLYEGKAAVKQEKAKKPINYER